MGECSRGQFWIEEGQCFELYSGVTEAGEER
jgi:hypothetical protein